MPKDLPESFIKKAKAVTAKRAKTVIDHILKHGHITTEELKNLYGYNHPPRAVRDVREQGIPLETFRMHGQRQPKPRGLPLRRPFQDSAGTLAGRKCFCKEFRERHWSNVTAASVACVLTTPSPCMQSTIGAHMKWVAGGGVRHRGFNLDGGLMRQVLVLRALQQLDGETGPEGSYDVLFGASPASYRHIAMRPVRRLELVWTEQEVAGFDKLSKAAQKRGMPLPDFIKTLLCDRRVA